MTKDSLGDYLKSLENHYNGNMVSDVSYLYMRLDGRSFSKLTKKMIKPEDKELSYSMKLVVQSLYDEFQPDVIMQQSDEISLLWKPISFPQERIFGGKYVKLLSLVPSYASSVLSQRLDRTATFDARLLELSYEDAIKMFWWRYKDCKKNAISSTANNMFSEKFLNGKTTGERFDLIKDTDIWKDCSNSFKHGYWIFKRKVMEDEIERTRKVHIDQSEEIVFYSTFVQWFENELLTINENLLTS